MTAPGAAEVPDVTVVTVTYEAGDLVLECLRSLRDQELGGLRMAVVVVDNASTDGTADRVARAHPEVRLLRSPVNLGFAGGNNLALREVASPYVVLLNNDAVAEPGAVAALVRALADGGERLAAVTATVLLAGRFRAAGPDDDATVLQLPRQRRPERELEPASA